MSHISQKINQHHIIPLVWWYECMRRSCVEGSLPTSCFFSANLRVFNVPFIIIMHNMQSTCNFRLLSFLLLPSPTTASRKKDAILIKTSPPSLKHNLPPWRLKAHIGGGCVNQCGSGALKHFPRNLKELSLVVSFTHTNDESESEAATLTTAQNHLTSIQQTCKHVLRKTLNKN